MLDDKWDCVTRAIDVLNGKADNETVGIGKVDWDAMCVASDDNYLFTKENIEKATKMVRAGLASSEQQVLKDITAVAKGFDAKISWGDSGSISDGLLGVWQTDPKHYDTLSQVTMSQMNVPTYDINTDFNLSSALGNNLNYQDRYYKAAARGGYVTHDKGRSKSSEHSQYSIVRRSLTDMRTIGTEVHIEITTDYEIKDADARFALSYLNTVMWWKTSPLSNGQIKRLYDLHAKNNSNLLRSLTDEIWNSELISIGDNRKRIYGVQFQLCQRIYFSLDDMYRTRKMIVLKSNEIETLAYESDNALVYGLYSYKADDMDQYSDKVCLELEGYLYGINARNGCYYKSEFLWMKCLDHHVKLEDAMDRRVKQIRDKVGIYGVVEV